MADRAERPPTNRFLLLYALAWAGGTIAYTPLLTILLPVKVETLVGKSVGVGWLASIALVGAIAASVGGILFGYLSDVTRNRRGWIAAGLVLSNLMLFAIGELQQRAALIAAIVVWQLALNMMLAPLAALPGDVVPDDHKGVLGGLMAFAPGLGALSGAIVTLPWLVGSEVRLGLVAAMVSACVFPVLVVRLPQAVTPPKAASGSIDLPPPPHSGAPVLRMWCARLAVQVAEAALFSYLYFWLLNLDPAFTDNQTARLFSTIMLVAAPMALAAGRWSDRRNRPILPLIACAAVSAIGLGAMALSHSVTAAMAAYAVFGLSSSVFLALHSAQTLRILPRPSRRGRDLGLFNLANTVPSLVMPWLALALVPLFGFPGLFALLAVLSSGSAVLLRTIDRRN